MRSIDRRTFLQQATAGAALAAGLPGCAARDVPPGRGPNLLFIMADDLGYGDLSSTGRQDYSTPVLDTLARAGVSFTHAYSAAPVCTPTRVALMTGRYPARNPIGLYEPLTRQRVGLAPEPATFARLIRDRGYETALIGKWHLGLSRESHPLQHGFDEFYGFLGAAADYRSHIDTETRRHLFQDGTRPVRAQGYLTDLFTERAIQFITRERDRPFFLNLQYNAPHWPWQAPEDQPYPDTLTWVAGGSPETFAKMVESMDHGIGRVLDALHERGLDSDTLVIFTSDNGGERFSHMGNFSKGKMTLWEGGIRVAAIARWPGVIPAASTSNQLNITMDWTTTLLARAGAQPDPDVPPDGIDLLPALTGSAPPVARQFFWRIFQRSQQHATRSGKWKYLATETGEHL
ncbi:MAG TPA: sulfatase-like hydrolase/transferase, partial [Longimicrobiales bacterium]|nr:sulfatase-like hydrolase/transferase [Longimicrobiales bacterium]